MRCSTHKYRISSNRHCSVYFAVCFGSVHIRGWHLLLRAVELAVYIHILSESCATLSLPTFSDITWPSNDPEMTLAGRAVAVKLAARGPEVTLRRNLTPAKGHIRKCPLGWSVLRVPNPQGHFRRALRDIYGAFRVIYCGTIVTLAPLVRQ